MSSISVPGFENYKINSEGQIIGPRGRALKGGMDKNGYILVTLRRGGSNFTRKAHRLVCEAFHEKVEGKTFVNHKDGIKCNNHPDNLEWCTPRENTLHSYDTGLQAKGEKHGRAKISDEDVAYIRENIIPRDPHLWWCCLRQKIWYNPRSS